MTASPSSVLGDRLATVLIGQTVADAAGVLLATWASLTAPRVFRGIAGYMGGRNRGRLPFLEYSISVNSLDQIAIEGGTLIQTVRLRVHCGTASLETAENLTAAILLASMAAIRSETTDNLAAIGNENIDELITGPWGLMRDATLTVDQNYSRTDYDVT